MGLIQMSDKFYSVKPSDLKIGQYFSVEGDQFQLTESIKQNNNVIEITCKDLKTNLQTLIRYNTQYPFDIYTTKINQEYR